MVPGHGNVSWTKRLCREAAVGRGHGAAAQDLEAEAFVIVTDPSEASGDPHPDVPGHDDVREGVGPDHPHLPRLVIRVEGGPGPCLLVTAVLPRPSLPAETDLDTEADVAHVVLGVEDVRRSLTLEAGHEARLAEVDLKEDVSGAPGLDIGVMEAPGGGRMMKTSVLRPGVWKRRGQAEVRDVTGLKAQRCVTSSAER